MNKKRLGVTIGIIALIGIVSFFAFITPGSPTQPVVHGQLTDQNDNVVSLEAYRGKVVFINNWASWCPPCVAEMPSIHKLKERLKDENVVFLMVSFDEKKDKALSFVKKKGFDFEVMFPGDQYPFPTASIPATFILDKNGNVVAEHTGMADYNTTQIYDFVLKLARE